MSSAGAAHWSLAAVALTLSALIPGASGAILQYRSKSEEKDLGLEAGPAIESTLGVAPLNRFMFDANVLECGSECNADHWIVVFCPKWYPPCQALLPIFHNSSQQWQNKLNADVVLRSRVRFAEVDCATDKPLCNDELVENYPTLAHYKTGNRVSLWAPEMSDLETLNAWIDGEIGSAASERAAAAEAVEGAVEKPPVGIISATVLTTFVVGHLGMVANAAGLLPGTRDWRLESDRAPEEALNDRPEAVGIGRFMPEEWANRGITEL